MIFRLWIAAAANCFLVLALSLKTLLMNYDIFAYFEQSKQIFFRSAFLNYYINLVVQFLLCILL